MTLSVLVALLDEAAFDYALIGGVALSAHSVPRATLDIDFLTTDTRVLQESTWTHARARGVAVEIRRGYHDDPLAGIVRLNLPALTELRCATKADVVVGRWQWQQSVVARAIELVVAGTALPVVRKSDLILLKMDAAGPQDLLDVQMLLRSQGSPC